MRLIVFLLSAIVLSLTSFEEDKQEYINLGEYMTSESYYNAIMYDRDAGLWRANLRAECYECYDDVNYPEMREWAKAGVDNGGGIPTGATIYSTISGNGDNNVTSSVNGNVTFQAEIDNAAAEAVSSGNLQVVLIDAGETITFTATQQMKDDVILRGANRQNSKIESKVIYTVGNNDGTLQWDDNVDHSGAENLTMFYTPNVAGCQPTDDLTDPSITQDFYTIHANGGVNASGTGNPCNLSASTLITTYGFSFWWTSNNDWLYQVDIDEMASNPIDNHGEHIEIRDVYVGRTFNKGVNGNGYIALRSTYALVINSTFERLRHIVIDNRSDNANEDCDYNVLYNNDFYRVEVNFHDGVSDRALVEGNQIRPESVHHCSGQPINVGETDSGHKASGITNIIYKNDISESGNPSQMTFGTVYRTTGFIGEGCLGNEITTDSRGVPPCGTFLPGISTLDTPLWRKLRIFYDN